MIMVHVMMRTNVTDYKQWRTAFDGLEDLRRSKGSTGAKQVYRDADNPYTITILLEWNNAGNSREFLGSAALGEAMQKAGVIGAPAMTTVVTTA
jgi:hypothetical protein